MTEKSNGEIGEYFKSLSYCMVRSAAITIGMVVVAAGTVAKNKNLKPLAYFSVVALGGDLINGYCITCRNEVRDFWIAKAAYDLKKLQPPKA